MLPQTINRVAFLPPFLLLFPRPIGPIDISHSMTYVTISLHYEEARPFVSPRAIHGISGCFLNSQDVHSIDGGCRDIEGLSTLMYVSGSYLLEGRIFPILIILADIDNRKIPNRSKIQ